MDKKRQLFVQKVKKSLLNASVKAYTKTSIEKIAAADGITDKNEVKELTELAIVSVARYYAHTKGSVRERFDKIVDLYWRQVNLSHRTSQSMLLQQYSTPAPISYLAGVFCELDKLQLKGGLAFEPSAGNGLLTIAADASRVYVNEIETVRRENLEVQGFANVWNRDSTKPFYDLSNTFDAVLTNPPFGTLDQPVYFEDYKISSLEHLMALHALDVMLPNGKAAIIIGGHTKLDGQGRIQAGKNRIFFNYLYSRYYVKDVININGHKLYSRQGTGFDVRLILIAGRKSKPEGVAPLHNSILDTEVSTFIELYDRVMLAMGHYRMMETETSSTKKQDMKNIEREAAHILGLLQESLNSANEAGTLEAPYLPASQACVVLDTQVPDSMAYETQSALDRIRREVGGDMDNFVRHRLGYKTKVELCKSLSAEQIDAVGIGIYNIEARGQGMIIGDQTGIGKGRVAASVIRYATQQGLKPVFLTEKANLFSDIYRDLAAIGSSHLRPFIVNARESKTDVKDEDGNVVYQAPEPAHQKTIISNRELPGSYDFVLSTYSQFNSMEKKPEKPDFLRSLAVDNIFILDEAHNSSGSSNTGTFMQGIIADTRGVIFLSATFAKRADNMPIYAMKTAISDCTMSKDELIAAITKGGVALQEVLSAQLVSEGQMLRRERSFEGVEVNYISLDGMTEEHRAISDNITEILRDIIAFQKIYVDKRVKEMDKIVAAEGKEIALREGTSQAGVDNMPYFSKVFQVINQMLFSLKAEAVADRAIMRLREGKKPVIAFASTMGSFIETLETDAGLPVSDGDTINTDFSEVLWRGLDGVLRYTEKDVTGQPIYKKFSLSELGDSAVMEYQRISDRITAVSTGITISPIDVIVQKLKAEGYTVAEVTGRKYELQLNRQTGMGLVLSRKKINTNDAFRRFNNNEVDVLMINQSGSTGASAHAIPTVKVPANEVRQRVMIVLQAELDISTEVQKRGRINRTGQILKPIYDYLTSAVPAEKRLMMMLQKKLKSLDANTTSNQKQSNKILDVPDFLNKYGDSMVAEYLSEYPDIDLLLDYPLWVDGGGGISKEMARQDAAHKVSGRVAILSTRMQAEFYNEIAQRYNDYVEYIKQVGEYDLEVEAMNLEAETVNSRVLIMGNGSDSVFGNDSILETVKANVLKKPFSRTELNNLLADSLKDGEPGILQETLINAFQQDWQKRLDQELGEVAVHYEQLVRDIPSEKKIQKLDSGTSIWLEAIKNREKELSIAKEAKIKMVNTIAGNKKDYLVRLFKFFYPSRCLQYPFTSYGGGSEMAPAVFLGYTIDNKKKNPFVPSQVKLRFAIAASTKYLVLTASMSAELLGIIGASVDVEQPRQETLLNNWESYIKKTNVDRTTRHIITGNLLQASGGNSGKLISYTTIDGQTKKGILLPEAWQPAKEVADKVTVPIIKALPLIQSIVNGGQLITNNGLAFFKKGEQYRIIVPSSRSVAGDIFLDKDLLALVDGNNFQKVSNNMSALLPENRIKEFVKVLGEKHGLSITVNGAQFRLIEQAATHIMRHRFIELPPPMDERAEQDAQMETTKKTSAKVMTILELEVEALELELLLSAA